MYCVLSHVRIIHVCTSLLSQDGDIIYMYLFHLAAKRGKEEDFVGVWNRVKDNIAWDSRMYHSTCKPACRVAIKRTHIGSPGHCDGCSGGSPCGLDRGCTWRCANNREVSPVRWDDKSRRKHVVGRQKHRAITSIALQIVVVAVMVVSECGECASEKVGE